MAPAPPDLEPPLGPAGQPSARRRTARAATLAVNGLLAAYLGWCAYSSLTDSRELWLAVRVVEAASSGLLAALVLFRPPAVAARWDAWALAAAVLSNGHGFAFDAAPRSSPGVQLVGHLAMAASGIWGSVSRLCLGRSFAILPALRDLKTSGPYAVVRHPIYLSLVVYDLATVAAHLSAWNAVVATIGIVSHVSRVTFEERVLARDPQHAAYRAATPSRLIPGVW